jgi:hypothetical protein
VTDETIQRYFPVVFPLFFVTLWLVITTMLSLLSGWFRLMRTFPDRPEPANFQLKWQSGSMGAGVSMRSLLTLSACPSGLRVQILRLFGPFSRPFFVPWDQVSIVRKKTFFFPVAKLSFGRPSAGSLTLAGHVADNLARETEGAWPEIGSFPPEKRSAVFRRAVVFWAIPAGIAALFFIVVTRMIDDPQPPPILPLILLPAALFGVGVLVDYFRGTR